jgi:hypothetical protein
MYIFCEDDISCMDDTEPSLTEHQTSRDPSSEGVSSDDSSEFIDELYTTELQSTDGWLEGEVTQIEPTAEGEQLSMSVMVGTGETVTWTLETPDVWTDEYLFVRLAEQYDYGAGAIDLLAGETLRIRPDTGASDAVLDTTGEWELDAPARSIPLSNRLGAIGDSFLMFVLAFILSGIIVVPAISILLFVLPGGTAEQMLIWGGILIWVLASIGIAAISDSESSTEESDSESTTESSE